MPARLLVVALDGADGRLLDRATLDGTLPTLSALRSRGRAWRLSSTPADTDDSLWASFQYGVGTGEHGRYECFLDDDYGGRRNAPDEEIDRETFWDRLSSQGHHVAVLDIPKCRRPRALNGIHLADWLVHGRYFPAPVSYPAALAEEIVARFGPAPPSRCAYAHRDPIDDAAVKTSLQTLLGSITQKRDAGVHYLSQRMWDLFAIGFKEAHCCGHLLWEFNDPSHAQYDAERVARLGNPVLEVMKAQDRAIGELVAQAGPDAEILVFSPSDFAPNGTLVHLMDAIAARLDHVLSTLGDGGLFTAPSHVADKPNKYCRLVFYGDAAGALRVPRQPSDTEAGYQRRLELIVELARELVSVDDGLPVVSRVSYPAWEETGQRAATLPHILLHYRANAFPSAVSSPRLGRFSGRVPHMRTGNHAPGGFSIAAGPRAAFAAEHIKTMADFAAFTATVLTKHPARDPTVALSHQ